MIPIVFAEAIHSVTVEQAQGLWMDGTIDRVRFDGVDYFMAADMALTLADQGLLHEDAFVARAGIKKGGGACGRGWVGVQGSCKRIKKGEGDRDSQHKQALKEFAQGQRFKGSSKGTKSLMGIGMGKHQEAARDKQSAELGKSIKERAKARSTASPGHIATARNPDPLDRSRTLAKGMKETAAKLAVKVAAAKVEADKTEAYLASARSRDIGGKSVDLRSKSQQKAARSKKKPLVKSPLAGVLG